MLSRRSLIQQKVVNGGLPSKRWETVRVIDGGSAACSGCETPTRPHELAAECVTDGSRVVLHPDCFIIWEEARATRDAITGDLAGLSVRCEQIQIDAAFMSARADATAAHCQQLRARLRESAS